MRMKKILDFDLRSRANGERYVDRGLGNLLRSQYSLIFFYMGLLLIIIVIMVDQLCGMMLIVANTIQIWVCVCEQATPPSILMVYEYAKCALRIWNSTKSLNGYLMDHA